MKSIIDPPYAERELGIRATVARGNDSRYEKVNAGLISFMSYGILERFHFRSKLETS